MVMVYSTLRVRSVCRWVVVLGLVRVRLVRLRGWLAIAVVRAWVGLLSWLGRWPQPGQGVWLVRAARVRVSTVVKEIWSGSMPRSTCS